MSNLIKFECEDDGHNARSIPICFFLALQGCSWLVILNVYLAFAILYAL